MFTARIAQQTQTHIQTYTHKHTHTQYCNMKTNAQHKSRTPSNEGKPKRINEREIKPQRVTVKCAPFKNHTKFYRVESERRAVGTELSRSGIIRRATTCFARRTSSSFLPSAAVPYAFRSPFTFTTQMSWHRTQPPPDRTASSRPTLTFRSTAFSLPARGGGANSLERPR